MARNGKVQDGKMELRLRKPRIVLFKCLSKTLESAIGIPTVWERPKKFKRTYYPPTVRKLVKCKKLVSRTTRKKTSTTSPQQKSDDDSGGDPASSRHIVFSNCVFNIGNADGDRGEKIIQQEKRIAELEGQLEEARKGSVKESPAKEEVSTRRKQSYLKLIAVLCNRNGKIDPAGRESTGILKTELEKIGFSLGEDTIRNILKETQDVIKQETRIRV